MSNVWKAKNLLRPKHFFSSFSEAKYELLAWTRPIDYYSIGTTNSIAKRAYYPIKDCSVFFLLRAISHLINGYKLSRAHVANLSIYLMHAIHHFKYPSSSVFPPTIVSTQHDLGSSLEAFSDRRCFWSKTLSVQSDTRGSGLDVIYLASTCARAIVVLRDAHESLSVATCNGSDTKSSACYFAK